MSIHQVLQEILEETHKLAEMTNTDTTITYDHIWHPQKGLVKVWRVKEQ